MATLLQAPPAQSNSFLFRLIFLELGQIGKVASEPQIQELRNKNKDPQGGTWVNVCWLCAAGLSEPLPHYGLFFGQL